jgi:VWFA-related protein
LRYAIVTDKIGNPVTDLTVDDFKIYEDGNPQPIDAFALESYGIAAPFAASSKKPVTRETVPGEPNYTRPRLISIVIDDVTSLADDHYASMTEAVRKFIERDMGPGDQMALVAGSGGAAVLEPRRSMALYEEVCWQSFPENGDFSGRC